MITRARHALTFTLAVIVSFTVSATIAAPTLSTPGSAQVAPLSGMAILSGTGERFSAPPKAPGDADDGATDLYGNDVTVAIAKYRLNADGNLYEAHSPQTLLPRLGSPKS